jgi:hypothetical protein
MQGAPRCCTIWCMSKSARPPTSPLGTVRPGIASRRVGYAVAVLANVVILWLVTGWPGWRAVPFLTEATQEVLLVVAISLLAGVLVNLANLAIDQAWVKALGDIITSAIALIVLWRIWQVFPFAFHSSDVDWELVTRVAIGLAIAGCMISVVVQVVVLARVVHIARPRSVQPGDTTATRTVPESLIEREPNDARHRHL